MKEKIENEANESQAPTVKENICMKFANCKLILFYNYHSTNSTTLMV